MLSSKMLDVVINSILEDRNCPKGKILNKAESEKHIVIKVKDKGDEMVIKRDVKEALMIYWNIVISQEQKSFISTHCITFSDFRIEFEEVVEKVEGNADIDECILEALEKAAEKRVTKNLSRVQKSHNKGKKREEIHGKDEEPKEGTEEKQEGETLLGLPQPQQPDEPLALEPPVDAGEDIKEAEKVDDIEEAEIVEEGEEAEEIKEEPETPKKKGRGRPKKTIAESGV